MTFPAERPCQRLVPVEFSNPGFEDGVAGWSLPKKAAHDGTMMIFR